MPFPSPKCPPPPLGRAPAPPVCLLRARHLPLASSAPDGEPPRGSKRRRPRRLELAASKVAQPAARGVLQARRFKLEEATLRRTLFEHTGGMFPELVTRTDLSIFLPPIGGCTAYIVGDPDSIPDPSKPLAVRVHDECNGSDVFGSDICTCRPYLVHGIEECVLAAQQGGAGLIVYNRKEGRALGEVTKFMVYNARKRQEG